MRKLKFNFKIINKSYTNYISFIDLYYGKYRKKVKISAIQQAQNKTEGKTHIVCKE